MRKRMDRAEAVVEGAVVSSGLSKGAPVAVGGAVTGLNLFGFSLPDIVQILTVIYLSIMICHSLWKWWIERQERKRDRNDSK